MLKFRKFIIVAFVLMAIGSGFGIMHLKFSFDFEQFFPQGDEDLDFFREFREEFEPDDNFMLIAVTREDGVFDEKFLTQFADFTTKVRTLPHTVSSQSLTTFQYPRKTPFGFVTTPALHIDNPERYEDDRKKILADKMLVGNLIDEEGKTLVLIAKNVNTIGQPESEEFVEALDELIAQYDFDNHHYLGRPNFLKELVYMQKREIIISALVSGLLVLFIMFLIFRKYWGVTISMMSIGFGMLIFVGYLVLGGRELTAIAALYPVLMIIVGTSDVVHIMSKYIDELEIGKTKMEAIKIAIREIGMATFLTSMTTAAGFSTLMTSKVLPIREFGINAAVGVLIAYVTVLLFTTSMISFFKADQIIKLRESGSFWRKRMERFYFFTKNNTQKIVFGTIGVTLLCGLGISMITTNYQFSDNLPRGQKITEDFRFFEDMFGGFRPFEVAVIIKDGKTVEDFEVLKQIEKVEDQLGSYEMVNNVNSIATIYKGVNRAFHGNNPQYFTMPDSQKVFAQQQKIAGKLLEGSSAIMVSKDKTKSRITARVLDIGETNIRNIVTEMDEWIAANTDSSIVAFKQTGTGVVMDKNSQYVRDSLIKGLGLAILIVSLLMALLFRDWKMLIIALVPNMFPLLIAGAVIGFGGVELEAGITIVFAIIFGIAVDDTIHFLSKFKLSRNKGMSIEEALKITFTETGKAICLTSIILFFGFLVLLFSVNPPSVIIGVLISVTLLSALFSDLLIIPVMIRWMLKDK